MTYSDYRRIARERLAGNWGKAILVTLIAALLGGLMTAAGVRLNIELDSETVYRLPDFVLPLLSFWTSIAGTLSLVQFIVGGTVQLGYAQALLKQHHGAEYDVNDLFSQFHRFGQGFAQAFLRSLFIFLWALLFIIPGIVKSYSYAMTPFIMADNPSLTALEAIERSKQMMLGHKGELFILDLTFIGWMLLNVFTLGIGSLWLNPYMNAARAVFYRDLCPLRRVEDA